VSVKELTTGFISRNMPCCDMSYKVKTMFLAELKILSIEQTTKQHRLTQNQYFLCSYWTAW